MTTIKQPLVIDIAYNNVSMSVKPDPKHPGKFLDVVVPIDWEQVDFTLIKGVVCKASQSYITGTYEDTTFGHNWQELARKKQPRGAYHFYSNFRSSGTQAKEFVAIINK